MNKKNEEVKDIPVVEADDSVISPEDINEAVQGNEEALAEQMERVKLLSKEQKLHYADEQKKLEEAKKREEMARMEEEKRIKEEARAKIEAEMRARDEEKRKAAEKAQEEARLAAEAKRIEEERIAAEKEAVEQEKRMAEEKKKLEQEAKENAKKEKEAKAQALKEAKKAKKIEKVENDQPKEVDQNEKGGPTGFKRFMALIFFLVLFGMIMFMPQINEFINDYMSKNQKEEIITTGTSTCTLTKNSKNLDTNITATFTIISSKLYKLTYLTSTKGDKTEDREELLNVYQNCLKLKEEAGELDGVTISCSSDNGNVTNRQILDYERLDSNKVTTAYTEAGGVYPEFTKGENIDKIESKMTSAGYTCKRDKRN